ncbi:MAG TPA: CDP-diacylglycerol O-phosphatidyltransferase [Candidatus Binatia bacterium]|nr:CDP-diacylglycerol O-phosphatidyltransferase [Candidatus Binatia bacterium]
MTRSEATRLRVAAAWAVHALTASGAAAGVLALLATERGDAATAFWWMAYTIVVDSVDGTLARAIGVKRVVPFFDGTLLDNVVDYFTYVIVPVLFLLYMDLLPREGGVVAALCPVMASAYGFCRTDAKTADHYFTGFPSYWNVVAFYLYALGWPPVLNAVVLVALSVAVFVPVRYVYPSRTAALRPVTLALALAWGAVVLYVLARLDSAPRSLVVASLAFPVYYVGLSLTLHARRLTAR